MPLKDLLVGTGLLICLGVTLVALGALTPAVCQALCNHAWSRIDRHTYRCAKCGRVERRGGKELV